MSFNGRLIILACAFPTFFACSLVHAAGPTKDDSGKVSSSSSSNYLDLTLETNYSEGKYGTQTKTVVGEAPVTATYNTENWVFDVTMSYIRTRGPSGGFVIRGRPIGGAGRVTTQDGIGDTYVAATRYFELGSETLPVLDLKVQEKLATADSRRGLGTGKDDTSAEAGLSQPLGDLTLGLTGGYTRTGKPPGIKLLNYKYASGDVSYQLTSDFSAGVSYDYTAAPLKGLPSARDAQLTLRYKVTSATEIQGYFLKGLSDGSPDIGAGVYLKLSFR
jgi:hypothetical protein